MTKKTSDTSKSFNDIPGFKEAITEGKEILKRGGTKTEASKVIFRNLQDHPQDIVVEAFIKGASLTPRGALTYWYNRKRESKIK